jgi:nitroreductase/NAD-dependent dihydropyrimidine dehydrogenase PreA subunit
MKGHMNMDKQGEMLTRLKNERTGTEQVILARRSVRKYRKDQVPAWMVKRVLEAGRFAPSAGNSQPWRFIVIRDRKIIDEITADVVRLSKLTNRLLDYRQKGKSWLKPFTKQIIRLKPADLHPTPFGALGFIADGTLDLYHGAPTVVIILKDVRGISNPDLDCGIAGQNMVLAAHSMGLGTCWVSFTKMAFQYEKKWNRFFGIEYPYKFISSIAIGWPRWEPDGFVERETHAVEWYEGGTKEILDAAIDRISLSDRLSVPTYSDSQESRFGVVETDDSKCTGCTICCQICPAGVLEVADKMMRMKHGAECMFCGDCQAICPTEAIKMLSPMTLTGCYKTLDRGAPKTPRLDG